MISSLSSEGQQRQQFIKKILRLRAQNNSIRKQIVYKIQQIFNLVKQNPESNHMLSKQKQLISLFNSKNNQSILQVLTSFYSVIQEQLLNNSQVQSQVNASLKEKQGEFLKSKDEIMIKQITVMHQTKQIQSKNLQLDTIRHDLGILLSNFQTKKDELINKKQLQSCYQNNQKIRQLQINWQKQKQYIIQVLQQRAQMRKKNCMIQRAYQILEQKLQIQQAKLRQFQAKKQRNKALQEQNGVLSDKLKSQRQRAEALDDMKRNQIFRRQIAVSADVVGKWDSQKKAGQKMLLSILEKVNKRLPSKKLEDVSQIINSAEEYYNRSSLSQASHQRNQQQEQQQEQRIGMQNQDHPYKGDGFIQSSQIDKSRQSRRDAAQSLAVNASEVLSLHQFSDSETPIDRMSENAQNQS